MEDVSDDDTFTFIPAQVRLTPYDRRLRELRIWEERYDELAKHPNNERRLAGLGYKVREAKKRFEEEKRRDADDGWRQRRNVDVWRAGEGREIRNASRRKVRSKPNEDLSHLTAEQKKARARGQRADANFIKRRTREGMSEADIEVALELRRRERIAKLATKSLVDRPLADNPGYGMF
ncbi:hypothetical protein [Agrobacterium larrymoorei]|uniref:Uncharacterized protein n=1 Tax=Agrobacterium larrymoorei TaxID=160699 RepID=A0AAF0HAQ7_9HYPH|nr:hypothetical protein [Agrobacterium larrymoorei]WHA42961.1 hypothetical protein CFBP5477_016985 [Agrobacterium larrymoorei]